MYSPDLPLRKGSIYSSDQLPASSAPAPTAEQALPSTSNMTPDPYGGESLSAERGSDVDDIYSVLHRKLVPVVHVLAAAMAVSVAIDALNGTLFSWHPTFMTLGFAGVMSEGILLAIYFRPMEPGPKRRAAIERHLYVQLAALGCIAIGFWAIWQNKVCLHVCCHGACHPRAEGTVYCAHTSIHC